MTRGAGYRQIADALRVRIGGMADGDPLPSLPQIEAEWEVSVLTARRAIAQLEKEGLVWTRGGRQAVVARARRVACPMWATYALRVPEGQPIWAQAAGGVVILRVIP